jgi:DNA mismatch repair protein MutL
MKTIKVLPEGLIDRIAAGEVIENPASVIKELMENSLDAAATSIEISVKGGGKEEILMVDNGEGISRDQVEIAFMRHATSKIKSFEDLLKTGTMGFRGEALPSISSVSVMELSTCADGEDVGTKIRFEGGKQTHLGPAPPKKGCSISVRNLFYNVPARRKFLKSDNSERRKIAEIIRRYIIARPDVEFNISYDGKSASSFPAERNLRKRLGALWGGNISGKLISIEQEPVGPVMIYGFLSPPDISRANRSEVFFFVNKRPVVEKAMYGALAAAYEGSLPKGQFPYAAVFLDIDPGFVDINVHPAKIEVRFSDTGFIFTTLKSAMKSALRLPASIRFRSQGKGDLASAIPFEEARKNLFSETLSRKTDQPKGQIEDVFNRGAVSGITGDAAEIDHVFQIFDTYILLRRGRDLIMLDQHTAHERVIFEKTLQSFDNRPSSSQRLLFEARVKLTPEESSLVQELSDLLAKTGFEIRQFGDNEIIIAGVPQELSNKSPESALKGLLAVYFDNRKSGSEVKRALAAAISCKAAVKAGQRLTDPQMRGLYDDLMNCHEPFKCPHGRPTLATLNRDDLEKIFRR